MPSEGINLICGRNGEGKTNLAESLWLLTGCQSFRTKRLRELICHGENSARIDGEIFAQERRQTIGIDIAAKRQGQLNGISLPTIHALLGTFPAVFFSPDTLALVREGGGHRRRFFDIAISLQKPAYAAALSKYCKALAQRNALLRSGGADLASLEPWDFQLARTGAKLIYERSRYAENLSELCGEIYEKLSGGGEKLTLKYTPCVANEECIEENLLALLQRAFPQDSRWLYTTVGVHKEDIALCLDGREARVFGSRGQLRCCALSLKISEATLLRRALNEAPVVILDDVMSELDTVRQRALLDYLRDWQVFITCCEVSNIFADSAAAVFSLRGGKIL